MGGFSTELGTATAAIGVHTFDADRFVLGGGHCPLALQHGESVSAERKSEQVLLDAEPAGSIARQSALMMAGATAIDAAFADAANVQRIGGRQRRNVSSRMRGTSAAEATR